MVSVLNNMKIQLNKWVGWLSWTLLLLLSPLPEPAQEAPVAAPKSGLERFLERDYLLGDWGGLRSTLSSNGVDWVQNGQSEQLYPDTVLFMLEDTAHNNDGRTNRVSFQHLSDTVIPGVSVVITQQPQDASIDANHPVSFSASATAVVETASLPSLSW